MKLEGTAKIQLFLERSVAALPKTHLLQWHTLRLTFLSSSPVRASSDGLADKAPSRTSNILPSAGGSTAALDTPIDSLWAPSVIGVGQGNGDGFEVGCTYSVYYGGFPGITTEVYQGVESSPPEYFKKQYCSVSQQTWYMDKPFTFVPDGAVESTGVHGPRLEPCRPWMSEHVILRVFAAEPALPYPHQC